MVPLNDINFEKTNGGMGRTAASEDPISGLCLVLPEMANEDFLHIYNKSQFDVIGENLYAAKIRYPEQLADYGFVERSMLPEDVINVSSVEEYEKRAAVNTICYHVSEFFRMSPKGTLYLYISNMRLAFSGDELKALADYANGSIRRLGILAKDMSGSIFTPLQLTALELEREHKPLSLMVTTSGNLVSFTKSDTVGGYKYTPTITPIHDMTTQHFASVTNKFEGGCNISYLISCDLDPELIQSLGQYAYCGCMGACLGAMSKAAVNECIAWVQKFPLSLKEPGFVSGELLSSVSRQVLDLINENRYIFVLRHVGDDNNYFNDSHTLDLETSDYAYIENVQTIDKACREIRKNLLPYLNSPLLIDANSGKADPSIVAFLETIAGRALEDMEKAGELSGYSVTIDPDQNVLATSELEVVIKQVARGVIRRMRIKIGYTTKL
jgi:hypothetical protein